MTNLIELLNSQLEAANKDLKQADTELKAAKLKHSLAKSVIRDINNRIEKIQIK